MYEPEVNDYVQWTTQLGQVHQGWVYFKAEPTAPKRGWVTPQRYITIEIGVKPYCTLAHDYKENSCIALLLQTSMGRVEICCYDDTE